MPLPPMGNAQSDCPSGTLRSRCLWFAATYSVGSVSGPISFIYPETQEIRMASHQSALRTTWMNSLANTTEKSCNYDAMSNASVICMTRRHRRENADSLSRFFVFIFYLTSHTYMHAMNAAQVQVGQVAMIDTPRSSGASQHCFIPLSFSNTHRNHQMVFRKKECVFLSCDPSHLAIDSCRRARRVICCERNHLLQARGPTI